MYRYEGKLNGIENAVINRPLTPEEILEDKQRREQLYDEIMEKAVSVGVGMASPQRIDEINILQATYEAMREAIRKLSPSPDLLLNDAVTIPGVPVPQVPIIKGDAKVFLLPAPALLPR